MTDKRVLEAADAHFREGADKVKFKDGNDANAAYDVLRGPLTIYAYARVGRDWMDAEDCVQDAYVKVLETAKVNEFFNFGGLYKIWLDRAIRDKRTENRRQGEVIVEDEEVEGSGGLTLVDVAESIEATPELVLAAQTRVDDIMALSNTMKPKTKAIARLSTIFGYTNAEIAQMLNIKPKRVTNSLQWFNQELKEFSDR